MSRPRFLADEDLRRAIVTAALREDPDLDFVTLGSLGLAGAHDARVAAAAIESDRILVSHDASTMRARVEALIAAGVAFPGLFLVPQSRGTREVAESIVLIAGATDSEEWVNRIQYLPI